MAEETCLKRKEDDPKFRQRSTPATEIVESMKIKGDSHLDGPGRFREDRVEKGRRLRKGVL